MDSLLRCSPARKITRERVQGYRVNQKRIRKLVRLMGLRAIYRRPGTSKPEPGRKNYPWKKIFSPRD